MPTAAPAASRRSPSPLAMLVADLRHVSAAPPPRATRDELERESFARIAAGGPGGAEARRDFAARNLPLVIGLARSAWRRHYESHDVNRLMDLISIGCVSLMRAVDHFDVSRGTRFSTYATWCVRRDINRAGPRALKRVGRDPNPDIDLPDHDHDPEPDDVRDRLDAIDPADPHAGAGVALEAAEAAAWEIGRLAGWLALLRPRYRRVLVLRYGLDGGEPRTLEAVGKAMGGVTKERARQLERAALGKLRGIAGAGAEGDRDRDREGKGG